MDPMPHARNRFILPLLIKRLSFFPVLAVQGARQTGKSFLMRELLPRKLADSVYLTFDHQSTRSSAEIHPHSLLAEYRNAPLIIDEAQKVPGIFDAIKFEVDQNRRPGRYILLGSTEFSRLTLVRESLTGRMGRVRLYPMTLLECLGDHSRKAAHRGQTMAYMKTGGMPAIFSVRDEDARNALLQDWIDLTCHRDILQFRTLKLFPELTYRILSSCAKLEEPTRAHIATAVKTDPRRVQTHLDALTELFALQRLDPHPSGTGKPIYLPMDPGIAGFLGADSRRRLQIFLTNERLAQNAYFGKKKSEFYFYRSTGKRIIDLIEVSPEGETTAYQSFEMETIKKTDAELMRAFLAKNPKATGVVVAPVLEPLKIAGIPFVPWENICCRPV